VGFKQSSTKTCGKAGRGDKYSVLDKLWQRKKDSAMMRPRVRDSERERKSGRLGGGE